MLRGEKGNALFCLISIRGFHAWKRHITSIQVDITEVPDFNGMYELYDPVSVMFFYR